MIQKMENVLELEVTDGGGPVDFTDAANVLLVLSQKQCGVYVELPAVWKDGKLICTLSYKDAMRLGASTCEIQLMWTTADGSKRATAVEQIPVDRLIREEGYD